MSARNHSTTLGDRLLKRWYADAPAPWLLRPLSWLYRALSSARAAMYRHGWLSTEGLAVPVLVVGNLTVGGTGKTPLTIALVDYLRMRGWHPGVVSRGYGGRQGTPELLDETSQPRDVGDEPCLIRRRTGAPVAVGRDRPAAARLLVEAGADVVIADDGLQHYRLRRDIEVCVIDGIRRFGNAHLLPSGPLREPLARLRRVDFRVCNGGMPREGEILLRLLGDSARKLGDPQRQQPLHAFIGTRVHAVAGIGNPRRFFESLRVQRLDIIEHAFPDHHAFTAADIRFGDDLPVLMTEKDAIKCAPFTAAEHWYVPVRAVLPEPFLHEIDARLRSAARRRAAPTP